MRYPDFNPKIAARLTPTQEQVYIHVCGLLNRDHPIYTIDRKWESLAEVKAVTGHDLSRWDYNGIMFEAVTDIQRHYYFVVYTVRHDPIAKINRDQFSVYQVTNKGRALRMGMDAGVFPTKEEAEHMINILHSIEIGEF